MWTGLSFKFFTGFKTIPHPHDSLAKAHFYLSSISMACSVIFFIKPLLHVLCDNVLIL